MLVAFNFHTGAANAANSLACQVMGLRNVAFLETSLMKISKHWPSQHIAILILGFVKMIIWKRLGFSAYIVCPEHEVNNM